MSTEKYNQVGQKGVVLPSEKKYVFWKHPLWQYLKVSIFFGLGLTLVFLPFNDFGWVTLLRQIASYTLISILIWAGIEWMVDVMDQHISWLERPILRMLITLFSTVIYSIIIVVGINALYYWWFFDVGFWDFMERATPGIYYSTSAITIIIGSILHGRGFLMAWKDQVKETEELKRAHIAAQYESLKNQVNPHFLFNSLNVLSNLVYKDADLSAKFIKQLSLVYRYVLDTRNKEVVTLKEELDALEAYIFLMKIRFGESLKVSIDLDSNNNEMTVPLTLQMLFENAIKHNEVSKTNPLEIQIGRLAEDTIFIKNKLQAKGQIQHKSGVGLENIKARHKFISEKEVEIIKTDASFEVRVPIVKLK
jgi:hypothetical protein